MNNIKRRNSAGFYSVDGEDYVSVTTVISNFSGKGLCFWYGKLGNQEANRVLQASSKYGTYIYSLLHNYFFEKDQLKLMDMEPIEKRLQEVEEYFNKQNYTLLRGESKVCNKKYKYAGTMDFIAQSDKGVIIGDYKTTNTEKLWEQWLQLSAYAHCDDLPYIFKGEVINLYKDDGEQIKIREYFNLDVGFQMFLKLLDCFLAQKNVRNEIKLKEV